MVPLDKQDLVELSKSSGGESHAQRVGAAAATVKKVVSEAAVRTEAPLVLVQRNHLRLVPVGKAKATAQPPAAKPLPESP